MKPEFNYQLIPHGFAHCLNKECKRGNECLRYQASLHIPTEVRTFTVVNSLFVATAEECPYFKADTPVLFAKGMTHLLARIPHNDAIEIKREMLKTFGRTLYYRFWRKEHLFNPKQQEYICQLFQERGLTDPPVFDEFIEQYEW